LPEEFKACAESPGLFFSGKCAPGTPHSRFLISRFLQFQQSQVAAYLAQAQQRGQHQHAAFRDALPPFASSTSLRLASDDLLIDISLIRSQFAEGNLSNFAGRSDRLLSEPLNMNGRNRRARRVWPRPIFAWRWAIRNALEIFGGAKYPGMRKSKIDHRSSTESQAACPSAQFVPLLTDSRLRILSLTILDVLRSSSTTTSNSRSRYRSASRRSKA